MLWMLKKMCAGRAAMRLFILAILSCWLGSLLVVAVLGYRSMEAASILWPKKDRRSIYLSPVLNFRAVLLSWRRRDVVRTRTAGRFSHNGKDPNHAVSRERCEPMQPKQDRRIERRLASGGRLLFAACKIARYLRSSYLLVLLPMHTLLVISS